MSADDRGDAKKMSKIAASALQDSAVAVKVIPAGAKSGRPMKASAPRDSAGKIPSSQYETPERRALLRAARKEAKKAEEARIQEDAGAIARWIRMREIITALSMDSRLGTLMGRMFILGQPVSITASQFEAGRRYANLLAAYDSVVLNASRSARSIDPNSTGGKALSKEPDPDMVEAIHIDVAECRGALVQWALGRSFKRLNYQEPRHIVLNATQALVRGEDIPVIETMQAAVAGLQALARHWNLDQVPAERIRGFGEKAMFDVHGRVREFVIVRDGSP